MCPTLSDPIDCSPPGSSIHGIFQARVLECVCICMFSHLSCVQLFATPWTVAHQVPLSMEFSRQEHWSGLPSTSPGDLPDPGIKPVSLALAGEFLTIVPPGKPNTYLLLSCFSRVRLCATPETAAHQALPSLGFSRQEYWHALPFPSPGSLPHAGIEPRSPALQADSLLTEVPGKPQE